MSALEELRAAELELVAQHLPNPGASILELGGGSGFQARLLSDRGYDVTSIDVRTRPQPAREYHQVGSYDGVHIPFPDASFDVIFSSSVLEHVVELRALLAETRRVLRPGGLAVHVMPTPAWRFWTSITHYVDLPRRLGRVMRSRGGSPTPIADGSFPHSARVPRTTIGRRIRDLLIPEVHGEFRSATAELWEYRARRWVKRFESTGFRVESVRGNRLFFTGHTVFPISLGRRRSLARLLGASSMIYVLRP